MEKARFLEQKTLSNVEAVRNWKPNLPDGLREPSTSNIIPAAADGDSSQNSENSESLPDYETVKRLLDYGIVDEPPPPYVTDDEPPPPYTSTVQLSLNHSDNETVVWFWERSF